MIRMGCLIANKSKTYLISFFNLNNKKISSFMNLKTIVENIFQMEDELDLFSKQIGNIHFWELVRFNVFRQITEVTGFYSQGHTKLEVDSEVRRNYILNAVRNIFHKNPFLTSKCDILFLGSPRRKLMEDQLWWDIHSDPVMESLGDAYKCLLIEPSLNNSHFSPTKTTHIKYLDLALFLGTVLIKAKLALFCLSKTEENELEEIEKQILDRFNTSINLKKIVTSGLVARKSILPIYTFLIKKISPKVVVVTVSYGNKIIIEACNKLDIPVVELQHGASIGRYHLGYFFPDEYAKTITFPDYFFAFGDFWKNRCKYPIEKHRIFNVGYPFFEKETGKYAQISKKDQVVFISGGHIGKKMSRFAVQLKARKDFHLDIVYKLHPGEYARWKKEYPWLVNSGVIIVDDDSVPLYKLLAQSRALVGVDSTVVYEGLGFGLRTFLLDLPGIEYMDELIESQVVSVVSTVNELVEKIRQPGQQQVGADNFFKPNALDNISNALEEIIRRNHT